MLNEGELHYVEVGDSEEALSPKAPLTKGILSLCLGGLSIILAGLLGIILGVVARRLAAPVLLDFGGTAAARLALAGKITGSVGVIISVVLTVMIAIILAIFTALAVWLLTLIPW